MTGNGIFVWNNEKAEEALTATRAAMDEEGATTSLAADVPTDHVWWDGDNSQWSNEPALKVFDAWHPIIHRPRKVGP